MTSRLTLDWSRNRVDAASTTLDIYPNGTTAQRLIYLIVDPGQSTDPTTIPTGWEQIAKNTAGASAFLFRKVTRTVEPTFWQFEWGSSANIRAVALAYKGRFNMRNPEADLSADTYNTNNTTLRAGTVTSVNPGTLLFLSVLYHPSTISVSTDPTNPGSFTQDYENYDATYDTHFYAARYQWSSSGATGNIDAVLSTSNQYKQAFAVAVASPKTNAPLLGCGL